MQLAEIKHQTDRGKAGCYQRLTPCLLCRELEIHWHFLLEDLAMTSTNITCALSLTDGCHHLSFYTQMSVLLCTRNGFSGVTVIPEEALCPEPVHSMSFSEFFASSSRLPCTAFPVPSMMWSWDEAAAERQIVWNSKWNWNGNGLCQAGLCWQMQADNCWATDCRLFCWM